MLLHGIVGYLAWFGTLACFILVLIKQFEYDGVFNGVVGILSCGIWTYIWGWINARERDLFGLMLLWTLFVGVRLLGIVF